MILLSLGKLEESYQSYEQRNHVDRNSAILYTIKKSDWDGFSLKNKTIIAQNEQGIRNEILFNPAVFEVYKRAKKTIIGLDYRLKSLFQRTFTEAKVVSSYSKIHDFDDLNQMKGLDGTSTMIKCLGLVISQGIRHQLVWLIGRPAWWSTSQDKTFVKKRNFLFHIVTTLKRIKKRCKNLVR